MSLILEDHFLFLTLVFPPGVLTLETIFPLEIIHFSMSLESPGRDLSLILEGHLVFPLGVLTLETISLWR